MHAATSKVENSAQGSSCKLKFVYGFNQMKLCTKDNKGTGLIKRGSG